MIYVHFISSSDALFFFLLWFYLRWPFLALCQSIAGIVCLSVRMCMFVPFVNC